MGGGSGIAGPCTGPHPQRGMMRSHRPSPALLASALLFACTEATPPPQVGTARPQASASAPTATAAPDGAPRRCAFQGVVRSQGGAPVAGALVAANPPASDEPVGVARTDDQGRYCFETLAAGSYGFTITSPSHTAAYVDVREVQPAAAPLDVEVGGTGFVLRGRVTNDKGAPLAGARVLLPRMSDSLADIFLTETGPDGQYQVKLPAATYQVRIRTERAMASTSVDLGEDRSIDFVAQRLNPKDQPAPEEVVAWIRQNAIPLTTPEAEKGLDDMEPLKALVGDARLVALGEATHGTREFFQLKHRMLEFLVEKLGFRAFGIEASFGDCLPLTEYVRTGKGDPKAALANQGFWTWDTEEVLALVKWMRSYNEDRTHKEKLSFWGFDMQSPASSTQALLAYFTKVDKAFVKAVGPALEPLDDDFAAQQLRATPGSVTAELRDAVKKIASRLDAKRSEYELKTATRDLQIARIHARILFDFLLSVAGEYDARDRSMAEVAAALLDLEGPDSRMVLWAHNGHISELRNAGLASMGSHLEKRFGAGYFSFGFAFDEGSFQAVDVGAGRRGLTTFSVPSAPPGSLDHTLARAGVPLFALSLRPASGSSSRPASGSSSRPAPKGPVSDWLSAGSVTRSIGSVYDERQPDRYLVEEVLPEHYDALLFVQKATAARSNETGKRPPEGPKEPPPATLADPGFEGGKVNKAPPGWKLQGMPRQLVYRATVTNRKCATGKRCLAVARDKAAVTTGVGSAATGIDATPWRGKKVRISAAIRVEGKGPGDEAFLAAYARPSEPKLMTSDKMAWTQAPGPAWKTVHVDVDVPLDAGRLVIALMVTGAAKAGLDDIEVSAPEK